MQTVSSAWKQAQQQNIVPESFVEVSYRVTDPEAEADAQATDNGHMSFADTPSIVSPLEKSYAPYIVLEQNSWVLDGTRTYLAEQDTGFVSSVLSEENKSFTSHPVITITFSEVMSTIIPGVTIQWSTAFDEWATSFTVTAYSGNNVVATQTFSGTTSTTFASVDLSGYNKIEIDIASWCLPGHRARIEQITLGAIQVFTKTELIGYEQSQYVDLLSLQLPEAQCIFEINNVEGDWNPDNPQGVYKYLIERQQISVRYGYKLDNAIEWIAGGVFYMSEWETPQNGISARFTARDALEFMGNPFTVSTGTYTLQQLCTMAFQQSNLPVQSDGSVRWVLDSSLASISVTIPTDDDGNVDFDYTCAEVVQLCANAALCVMYQDREGVVHVSPLASTLTDYDIDEFVSYQNAEYEISKQLQSVNVNKGMGSYTAGESGEVQTIENPLIQNSTVAGNVAEWVAGVLSQRKTLSGSYRADPRLDALDKVTVVNKYASNTAIITNVTYTYNGAFRGSYEGRIMV